LVALAAMLLPPHTPPTARTAMWTSLHGGFRYAIEFAPIRAILLMVAVASLTGMPLTVLMPVFASQTLGGGPETMATLMSSMGIGALASAVYLTSRPSVLGLGKHIAFAACGFGLGMILFSWSRSLWFSVPILVGTGFCMMLQLASSNTMLQTIVDEDKRGRVLGLYAMSFLGVGPLGSLAAGFVAEQIGAGNTVRIAGAFCLVAGLVFRLRLPKLREKVRPIYRRLGILPEVTTAVEVSSQLNMPPEH
ncbi:MAG TPA: MFS transporter, partial [Pirellulales bacterium]|nr:MFS transporter [Pirellulales bacterium]